MRVKIALAALALLIGIHTSEAQDKRNQPDT